MPEGRIAVGAIPEVAMLVRPPTLLSEGRFERGPTGAVASSCTAIDLPDEGHCWELVIDSVDRAAPAEVVVAEWLTRLRGEPDLARWLGGVVGVRAFVDGDDTPPAGISAVGDRLVICTERPAPAFPHRLTQVSVVAAGSGRHALGGWIDLDGAVEFVHTEDPVRSVARGRASAAIVFGDNIDRALERDDVLVRPLPQATRVYVLVLDPKARWLVDPNFRTWLDARIDRTDLVSHVLAGRGRPWRGLHADSDAEPPSRAVPPVRRPFARDTRPRLEIGYTAGDRIAAAIAARLVATFADVDVRAEARPDGAGIGGAGVRVMGLSFGPDDPLVGLEHRIDALGGAPRSIESLLRAGERVVAEEDRRDLARRAVERWLADGTVLPLVRADAGLVERSERNAAEAP